MISQYESENFQNYLEIYNQSDYFTCNCCKVIVYSSFSDKSTINEMCNDDKQSIMLIFWCLLFKITDTVYHSYTFRVIKTAEKVFRYYYHNTMILSSFIHFVIL